MGTASTNCCMDLEFGDLKDYAFRQAELTVLKPCKTCACSLCIEDNCMLIRT